MSKRRCVAAGTVATVVLAGLTACTARQGDEGATSSVTAVKDTAAGALAALARTTSRSEHAQSAIVTATISGAGQPAPVTASGTYTWGAAPAFDTVVDTRSAGISDLRGADRTRMLFVGGAYYYQIDPQDTGPFQGKHWMRVDASAVMGEQGEAAVGLGSGDPTAGLKALKFARDVQDLGTETVRGRATRHYLVRVGPHQWGAAGDALTGRGKGSRMRAYTGDVKEITIGLWVDPRTDLPVVMEESIGAARVKIDFKEFGGPKTVTEPSAADTLDVTDQLKGTATDDPSDDDSAPEQGHV
ncbi:hypothetical protein ACFWXK_22680 [Streptomyces sp. NPDC059070]|uniref:hypothetical protein n=1 Tax=Streptomyces sp. NPDC059070 TaxID=3346713 RepID=UPI00367E9D60